MITVMIMSQFPDPNTLLKVILFSVTSSPYQSLLSTPIWFKFCGDSTHKINLSHYDRLEVLLWAEGCSLPFNISIKLNVLELDSFFQVTCEDIHNSPDNVINLTWVFLITICDKYSPILQLLIKLAFSHETVHSLTGIHPRSCSLDLHSARAPEGLWLDPSETSQTCRGWGPELDNAWLQERSHMS